MSNKVEPQYIFDSDVDNDIVDIYSTPKMKLKQIETDDLDEFRVRLEGKSIDHSVSNALRIVILKLIPIYGFHRSNIHIETEKSYHMYNNDTLFNLIETVPIFDIANYFDVEDPQVYLPTDVMRDIFGRFTKPKNVLVGGEDDADIEPKEKRDSNKKLLNIEFALNVKNITDDNKFVSTHDAVLKVDGKISKSYKKRDPICILVLKPNEEISLRAEANLGISLMYASYEATTNAISVELSPSKYEISYETLGQLSAPVIFQKSCTIMIGTLRNLHKFIKKKYTEEPNKTDEIKIELYGVDHAIGNVIGTTLQKCEYTLSAGYKQPDPMTRSIVIKYKLKPKSKIGCIQLFLDTLTYLITLYENIKEQSLQLK